MPSIFRYHFLGIFVKGFSWDNFPLHLSSPFPIWQSEGAGSLASSSLRSFLGFVARPRFVLSVYILDESN